MIPARGLTLLETVLASAMLAIIAAAIAPLVTELRYVDSSNIEYTEALPDLRSFADRVITDPSSAGLPEDALTDVGATFNLELPGGIGCQITVLEPPDDDVEFTWVVFSAGDLAISRSIELHRDAEPAREAIR